MRRLLWLCIPLLLAAAPQVPPVAARLGATLHLELPLPADATLAGVPDLGPFAARVPPQINNNTLILVLVPLRPGRFTLPALPLQGGQEHLTTEPVRIDVSAPEPPAAAHPLKALPTSTKTTVLISSWFSALAALAATLLFLVLWRRRRTRSSSIPLSPLDHLAVRFAASSDIDNPRWADFRSRLLRLRFAPLAADPADVEALTAEFEARQQEGS